MKRRAHLNRMIHSVPHPAAYGIAVAVLTVVFGGAQAQAPTSRPQRSLNTLGQQLDVLQQQNLAVEQQSRLHLAQILLNALLQSSPTAAQQSQLNIVQQQLNLLQLAPQAAFQQAPLSAIQFQLNALQQTPLTSFQLQQLTSLQGQVAVLLQDNLVQQQLATMQQQGSSIPLSPMPTPNRR
jgi:hypothetical protein